PPDTRVGNGQAPATQPPTARRQGPVEYHGSHGEVCHMSRLNLGPGGIARASASRPWLTIALWVVIAAIIIAGGAMPHQKDYEDDFTSAPDSQVRQNLIE